MLLEIEYEEWEPRNEADEAREEQERINESIILKEIEREKKVNELKKYNGCDGYYEYKVIAISDANSGIDPQIRKPHHL